jgi:pilus assembly protein FimV
MRGMDSGFGSIQMPPTRGGPDTRLTPETAMPVDTRMSMDSTMPADTRGPAGYGTQMDAMRFEATLPDEPTIPAGDMAGAVDPFAMPVNQQAVDFSSLDFDLGGAKADQGMQMPEPAGFDLKFDQKAPAPAAATELSFPPSRTAAPPTMSGVGMMPEVDLNLPPAVAVPNDFSAAMSSPPGVQAALEESLSRPTLLSDVGALPDEQAPRLTSNTDQATVPLIDFDLTGSDVELTGRRTETQAGSPLAAQMATKLDLARGYIDLGVKDGARELLEEVMRDGTREQRQQAVELMKQVEA